MLQYKVFDQSLYDKNDGRGKKAAIKFFLKRGFEATENPDKYGIDVLIYKENKLQFMIEVEVRGEDVWNGNIFKYSSLHIPYRKQRLIKFDTLIPIQYFVFNNTLTSFLTCNLRLSCSRQPIEVSNKYIPQGEYFFDVPQTEIWQYVLDNSGIWMNKDIVR